MPKYMEKFFELKISIATLIAWGIAILGSISGASAVYGKLEQRTTNMENNQARIERQLDRIESTALSLSTTVVRIEAEWKGKISPSNGEK